MSQNDAKNVNSAHISSTLFDAIVGDLRPSSRMGGMGCGFFKPGTIWFLSLKVIKQLIIITLEESVRFWNKILDFDLDFDNKRQSNNDYSHLVLYAGKFVAKFFLFGHAERIGALEGGGDKRGDTGGLHHNWIGFLFNV